MKLAYVMSSFDASHVSFKNGIGDFITSYLKKNEIEIELIEGYYEPLSLFFKGKQWIYENIANKKYIRPRETYIIKKSCKRTSEFISNSDCDAVFSFGSIPISYIKTQKPIIFWTDATFDLLLDYYNEYTNLSSETIRKAKEIESNALNNANLIIFSSEWAKQSAIKQYGINPNKIEVVPFGALLLETPSTEEIEQIFESRTIKTCKLLFIGKRWNDKGGENLMSIAHFLKKNNFDFEINVVGTIPPSEYSKEFNINVYPRLNKQDPNDYQKLKQLYESSHFFVLMSNSDCTPHVLNEANSFGVPCISSDTGGIPSIIKNNINGHIFSVMSSMERPARFIMDKFQNQQDYYDLALSSFMEYKNNLNWDVSINKIIYLINRIIQKT